MFEIQIETCFKLAVGVCCCLQICNSVVNMVVMGSKFHGCAYRALSSYVQRYLPVIIYCDVCCCLHVQ